MKKRIKKENNRPRQYLIIHTATREVGRVGLITGKKVVAEYIHRSSFSSRRSVLASVQALLQREHVSPLRLNGVFVVVGDGTFTAVRASLTTGYALAYALRIPVAPAPAALWHTPGKYLNTLRKNYSISPRYSAPPSITRPKLPR